MDIGDYESVKRTSEDLLKKYQEEKKTKYIIYSCNKMKELGLCLTSPHIEVRGFPWSEWSFPPFTP